MSKKLNKSELPVVQLPNELAKIVQDSKVENITEAEKVASKYVPHMADVQEQIAILKTLQKGNAQDCEKAKRISIECGHICSRTKVTKESDKADLLIRTRLIDGLNNAVVGMARMVQAEAKEISEYFDNLEKKRIADLAIARTAEMLPYCPEAATLGLGEMPENQYTNLLEAFKLKWEQTQAALKEEEERKLKEESDRKERERLLAEENEKLKKQAAEKNALRQTRTQILTSYEFAFGTLTKDLADMEEHEFVEAETLAKEAFEKLVAQRKKEKAERDKQEAELAAARNILYEKEEAEKKKALADAAEKKKKEEEAEALVKAPDKEKLLKWLDDFKVVTIPEMKSKKGKAVYADIQQKFEGFKAWANKQIDTL